MCNCLFNLLCPCHNQNYTPCPPPCMPNCNCGCHNRCNNYPNTQNSALLNAYGTSTVNLTEDPTTTSFVYQYGANSSALYGGNNCCCGFTPPPCSNLYLLNRMR